MDSQDNFRERFEALERRTQMVEQRLRWWRGMAGGLLVLGLLSWALPSGKAADAPGRGMAERMATMEKKLAAMDFDDAANEVVISGANLRIVNGLGATDTTNGLGNLIVGYNETRVPSGGIDNRTGSHNVVVGRQHNFSSFGGLVVAERNEISGPFASVSGGFNNRASGEQAAVCGGDTNFATGRWSTVSGGSHNIASSIDSSISGGLENTASSNQSSVCGGQGNHATAPDSTVCGGDGNTASGFHATVSGGQGNTASGDQSSVSGGLNRTAPGQFNWAAGALFSDM